MPEKLFPLFKQSGSKKILNALLFQAGWFACVLGGDAFAAAALVLILGFHALVIVENQREWLVIASIIAVGLVVDNALTLLGIFSFESVSVFAIPFWLLGLWALFAATLNHSLAWLQNRLWLAAILGALSGPSSYLAGSKLSSVELATPLAQTLLIIGLCWAVLLPLMLVAMRTVALAKQIPKVD